MADRTINELPAASAVGSSDLFVLEQENTAKKLTGQILENWLVSFADGHGGIQSIAKTGTSGTNPVVDTYTITLADETTSTFTVTNGIKGDTGAQTYVWVKWAAQEPTADNQMSNNPDEWIGIYVGLSNTAPTHYTDYTWYKYKGEQGSPGYAVDDVLFHDSTGGNVPGIAGATDTYYMYLNDPNNTYAGQFSVYNGNDGQGSPGSQTPLADNGSGAVGTANAYSREDHRHPLNVDNVTPANLGTAAAGSAGTYARRDHVHTMPSASDVGAYPTSPAITTVPSGTSSHLVDLVGGFYQYGKVVVVHIRVTNNQAISAGDYLTLATNAPAPITDGAALAASTGQVTSAAAVFAHVRVNGYVYVKAPTTSAISNNQYIWINGIYIAQ